jgi:hypothetical protein
LKTTMPLFSSSSRLSTPSLFSPLFYYIIEVVVFNARGQLSALCLPFERVDGAVEGPADRSMSGSVWVRAQDGVLSKAAWGGRRWRLRKTVGRGQGQRSGTYVILSSSSTVFSTEKALDPEVACELWVRRVRSEYVSTHAQHRAITHVGPAAFTFFTVLLSSGGSKQCCCLHVRLRNRGRSHPLVVAERDGACGSPFWGRRFILTGIQW